MQDPLESERLTALERMEVLDSPSEPLFDSLTDLAAQTFKTPIALISLVDQERQWFKACVGLDIDHTARGVSFCQHAILSDQVFVVLDAAHDERFHDNPLVTGSPNIRFYAGAPLITPEGHRLGALCVIDTVARETFTDTEASRLQAIAKSVMQALLMRLDVRERERIAVVAEQQNRLLKLAEEMAGVGTWSWDVAADRTTWSDQVYRIHGYEPGAEPPALQGVLERYHPDDAKVLADHVQRAVAEGRDYELEARIYRPDGSERHIVARGSPRRGPSGAVVAILGTFVDVTGLKLADENLRANEARLKYLMDQSADLIIRVEPGKGITWVSPSCRLYGFEPEELIGSLALEFFHPDDRAHLQAVRAARFAGLPDPPGSTGEYRVRHKDGRWIWVQGNPTLIRRADGQVIEIVTILRDVTAQRDMASALAATRDAAQEAAQVKADFLANMSHEIRTPLTGMLGFAGLLEALEDLSPTAKKYADRIATSGQALLSVVNDILDFSKLDADRIELDTHPFDPEALVAESLELVAAQAAAKGLLVYKDFRGPLPAAVLADSSRVRQVLLNLLTNAIKFTEAGAVTVTARYQSEDGGRLFLSVTDTGIGVPQDRLNRLFQRFSQVDGSNTRQYGGTGLGLAISKGLVERMGGRIEVESLEGEGSTFWFSIDAPMVELEKAPAAATHQPDDNLATARMLLVDDVAMNRELVRIMLSPFGFDITEAGNGAEAVAAAMAGPFDLILMDLQMPGMDGLAATKAIRSSSDLNRDTPIVALSANVLPIHLAECLEAGMNDHIAKPIVPAELLTKIAQWTEPNEFSDEADAGAGLLDRCCPGGHRFR
ncbi:MAG: PAS domain-containing protein [Caulobacter sp.]|nr:PAS domain-containing protein [Caulobacter sp.]